MSARRLTSVAVVSLCVGVLLCGSSALAARGHVFGGVFGEPCSGSPCGNGQFNEPSGVAVNEATGSVYVIDRGDERVERFSAAGAYEAQFNGSETPAKAFLFGSGRDGIAVDNSCYFKHLTGSACEAADPSNGDVYVVDGNHGVVDKLSSKGVYLGQLQEATGGAPFPFHNPIGVAVDTNGAVSVEFDQPGSGQAGSIASFTDTTESTFVPGSELSLLDEPLNLGSGFAVDSEDNHYIDDAGADGVLKFDGSGKRAGVFCAEEKGAPTIAVDLASDEVFLGNGVSVGDCSASGRLEERFGSGDLIGGSGLAVSHAHETVYVADGAVDVVDVFPPEPVTTPLVKLESVSDVTGNSAILQAVVDPRGASTEYDFEYGPCASLAACAGSPFVPAPEGFAGSGFEPDAVSFTLLGLPAGTVYHFRAVAHNEKDAPGTVVDGEERTFTTQSAGGGSGLLDGREWEMVSPPDKHGAQLAPIGLEEALQASAGGDALTYEASAPTEALPQGYANLEQVLSTRGSGGWGSRDIGIGHEQATGASFQGQEYRLFSEDLSLGVVQPFGSFIASSSPFALAPREASEQTAFLRTDYPNGEVGRPCAESCYRPLVTGKPGYANVPEGTVFGNFEKEGCSGLQCGPQFVGASPDLHHVVLESTAALTPGSGGGLFEWSEGVLTQVNVLPDGEQAGGPGLGSEEPKTLVGGRTRHAVSDDGSRVVWTTETPHLYMRDTARGRTVQLDVVQPGGAGVGDGGLFFQAASSDGSRVFFTDGRELTEGASATSNFITEGGNLYECVIVEAASGPRCELSDLTPRGPVLSVLGASEDGSWVYFASNAVLTEGEGAVPGGCKDGNDYRGAVCDLYVWHDGTTKLVAVLSSEDAFDWDGFDFGQDLNDVTSRVSPNGLWLEFMSQRGLTGYDSRDAFSGHPDEEVYLYSASSGKVVCASCNPTGARPVGVEFGKISLGGKGIAGSGELPSGTWMAANVPVWTEYLRPLAMYQSRYLSDSGRLFFNSSDALVSQDVNGTEDVYEYEPPGYTNAEGKVQCTLGSVGFSERSGGCVGLVSSGSSAEESAFLDASETGGDVFFLTAAKLASQDFDTALDVYDAHECTVSAPCFPTVAGVPAPCGTGDACKAAPSPQPAIYGAPSSATFSGAGNVLPSASSGALSKGLTRSQRLARALRACHRERGKRRAVCVRQARRRYGTLARSRKANTKRGGGR